MDRCRISVARRPCQHRGGDQELKEMLFRSGWWHLECRPLRGELVAEVPAQVRRIDFTSSTVDIEGVLVRLERDRVKCEPAVTMEITLLRRRHDEGVEAVICDERTH